MLRLFAALPLAVLPRAPADGASGTLGEGSVGAHELRPGAVGLDRLADMPGGRLLGREAGGSGGPQALTPTQAQGLLDSVASCLDVASTYAAAALSPAGAVGAIRTLGFDWPGDGGGAVYLRALAQPNHAGRIQTADGAWWELATREPLPEMFGALGDGGKQDGGTDDIAAIRAAARYCAQKRVPLHLTAPFGYAISGELLIETNDFTMIGNGNGRPTFWGLATGARVAVEAVANFRALSVNFDGRNGPGGAPTAVNGFIARAPEGELLGPTRWTLENCRTENTRGSGVRILRDTTEFRILGGAFRRVGRINPAASGAARFPDGHPPIIEVQGNGLIENAELAGGVGFALEVSAGARGDFEVFEEVHVRAVNVRAQSCFLGLVRVRDWLGDEPRTSLNSSEMPVQLNWTSGYMENPGIVTAASSPVDQRAGDDVVAVLAEGPMSRVAIDAPVKMVTRRARAAFRAVDGARIDVSHRGMMLKASRLGNATDERVMYETRAEARPGVIRLRSLPSIWGPKLPDAGGLDILTDWTQIARSAPGDARTGVLPAGARLLRQIADGASVAPVTSTAGVASATLTSAPGDFLGGGSAIAFACDPAAPAQPSLATFQVVAPAHWVGLLVMAECTLRWRQVGADFGGAEGLSHMLRAVDPVNWAPGALLSTDLGPIFPDMTENAALQVAAPGPDQATPWITSRVFFKVRRPGPFDLTVFLDATSRSHAHVAHLDALRLFALDGEGPGES